MGFSNWILWLHKLYWETITIPLLWIESPSCVSKPMAKREKHSAILHNSSSLTIYRNRWTQSIQLHTGRKYFWHAKILVNQIPRPEKYWKIILAWITEAIFDCKINCVVNYICDLNWNIENYAINKLTSLTAIAAASFIDFIKSNYSKT